MRTFTLDTLVTRCKQRCDLENDSHISDSEWKSLISEMVGELQLVVSETGMRYFETEASITANGASSYALPADHLATVKVDFVVDAAGTRRELAEIMVQEHVHVVGQTGDAFFFALTAQTIELYPKPASGTYKHLYIPQSADLSAAAGATTVDLVTADGEAFLIWGVGCKALPKSESDVRGFWKERDEARERLISWACRRSANTPRRVARANDPEFQRDPADWWPR